MQPVNIPQCLSFLVNEKRFVGWRWEQVPGKEKPTKVPYQMNGAKASSKDTSTWATFEQVCAAAQVQGFDGVGIQLLNLPGLAALDLDNVRNPETGELLPWAGKLCAACNSYTEVTPSGTGVRIIGAVLREHSPMHTKRAHHEGGEIELFVQPITGRFITVTGNKLPEAPDTLAAIDEQIGRVYSLAVTRAERSVPAGCSDPWGPPVADEHAMTFVRGSKAVADAFDNKGVTDPSEARYPLICSLAKATNGDRDQARRLFEASPLVQQNDPAKAMRDFDNHSWPKAAGKALAEHQQAVQAAAHGAQIAAGISQPASGQGQSPFDKPRRNVIELRSAYQNAPLPGFVIEGWIPEDDVTLWTGDGGIGKTEATIQTGLRVSANVGHMPFTANKAVPAGFWSAEDSEQRINTKIEAICMSSHVQLGGKWFDEKLQNFTVRDISGFHLWEVDKSNPAGKPTTAMLALSAEITETGAKIFFIDNVAIVCQFSLNDPIPVTAFVNYLRKVAAETKCAIVLLGHVSADSAVGTTRKSFFGTQAWHNAVRSRIFMEKIAENGDVPEHIKVSHEKSNYGPIMEPFCLRRNQQSGILMPFTNHDIAAAIDESFTPLVEKLFGHIREAQKRNDPVRAAAAGSRTSYHCLVGLFPQDYSESDRGMKKRIRLALARLADDGRIVKRNSRTPDRNSFEYWAVLSPDDPLYGKGI